MANVDNRKWYWALLNKVKDLNPGVAISKLRAGRQSRFKDATIQILADRVGISTTALSAFLKGESDHLDNPGVTTAMLIAALSVNPNDIPKVSSYYNDLEVAKKKPVVIRPKVEHQEKQKPDSRQKVLVENNLEMPVQIVMTTLDGNIQIRIYETSSKVKDSKWLPASTQKFDDKKDRYKPTASFCP